MDEVPMLCRHCEGSAKVGSILYGKLHEYLDPTAVGLVLLPAI